MEKDLQILTSKTASANLSGYRQKLLSYQGHIETSVIRRGSIGNFSLLFSSSCIKIYAFISPQEPMNRYSSPWRSRLSHKAFYAYCPMDRSVTIWLEKELRKWQWDGQMKKWMSGVVLGDHLRRLSHKVQISITMCFPCLNCAGQSLL